MRHKQWVIRSKGGQNESALTNIRDKRPRRGGGRAKDLSGGRSDPRALAHGQRDPEELTKIRYLLLCWGGGEPRASKEKGLEKKKEINKLKKKP